MRSETMSTILYIFIFSSWGLGLLSWFAILGAKLTRYNLENEERGLKIKAIKAINGAIPSMASQGKIPTPPWAKPSSESQPNPENIPEKVRELMKSSPSHPEVEEIDGTDQILGVRFEAENYPPVFGDEDRED